MSTPAADTQGLVDKKDVEETVRFVGDYVWHAINSKFSSNCNWVKSPYRSKNFTEVLGDSMIHWTRYVRDGYSSTLKKFYAGPSGKSQDSYLALFTTFTKQLEFFDKEGNVDMYSLLYLFAFCGEAGFIYSDEPDGYKTVKRALYNFLIQKILPKFVAAGGFEAFVKFVKEECEKFRVAYNDAVTVQGCHEVNTFLHFEPLRVGVEGEDEIRLYYGGAEWDRIVRSWGIEKIKAVEEKRLEEQIKLYEQSRLELEDELMLQRKMKEAQISAASAETTG